MKDPWLASNQFLFSKAEERRAFFSPTRNGQTEMSLFYDSWPNKKMEEKKAWESKFFNKKFWKIFSKRKFKNSLSWIKISNELMNNTNWSGGHSFPGLGWRWAKGNGRTERKQTKERRAQTRFESINNSINLTKQWNGRMGIENFRVCPI